MYVCMYVYMPMSSSDIVDVQLQVCKYVSEHAVSTLLHKFDFSMRGQGLTYLFRYVTDVQSFKMH
jgi:hypothetical protein